MVEKGRKKKEICLLVISKYYNDGLSKKKFIVKIRFLNYLIC